MTEPLRVVPVAGRRDLAAFIGLPYELYRSDSCWVPPLRIAQNELLDPKRHPFYKHAQAQLFLAQRADRTVGRVAAILDPNYNRFQREEAGFFGFFESVDDQEVANALLGAARDWLRERGAQILRGPMNPSTNYECGMLVEGFDSSPQVMMPYNPRYYPELMERAGLRKAADLFAYYVATAEMRLDKVQRVARAAGGQNGVAIRPIRMKTFAREVEAVWEIYNAAWNRNWGFVPMTQAEFEFIARDMKTILDPEMVLLGEVDGRVVGVAVALPDINQALKHAGGRLFPWGLLKILYHKRSIRQLRILILGVKEEYRTAGVAAAFYAQLCERAKRRKYKGAELSWVLESNTLMRRSIEAFGGKRYKTYRIYEWN